MKIHLTYIFVFLLLCNVFAQQVEFLAIEDIYDQFLENNNEILSYKNMEQVLRNKGRASGAYPDPVISYNSYVDSVYTKNGPMEKTISIMQNIPLGTLSIQRSISNQENLKQKNILNKIVYQKSEKFYTLFFKMNQIKEIIGLLEEELKLLDVHINNLRKGYISGKEVVNNIYKTETDISKIKNEIEINKIKLNNLNLEFNFLAGFEDIKVLPEKYDFIFTEMPDEIIYNPELEISRNNVEITRLFLEKAKKGKIPSLNLGLSKTYIENTPGSVNPDDGKDASMFSVSMTLPIGQKVYSKEKEALFKFQKDKNQHRDILKKIRTQFKILRNELVSNKIKMDYLEKEYIPSLEKIDQINMQKYKSGSLGYSAIIENNRKIINARKELINVLTDYKINTTKLIYLAGKKGDEL